MKAQILGIAVLCLWSAALVQAASFTGGENPNPFLNSAGGNQIQTKPGDEKLMQSVSKIQDNMPQNQSSGREYKAGDAANQAEDGSGAAAAAGAAMTAAAVAALMRMDYIEAARLFGMAGMEFAQAGASSQTQQQNQSQRDTLLAEAGQTLGNIAAAFNASETAEQLATPETKSALESAGIDPNAFLNQLASGQIQSGTQALEAIGKDPSSFSDEQIAQANATAMPEPLGNQQRALLGIDDGAQTNPFAAVGASGQGAGTSGDAASLASVGNESSDNGATPHSAPAKKENGTEETPKPGAISRALSSLLQPGMKSEDSGDLTTTKDAEKLAALKAMGILKPVKGQNIFKVASRNYRSFSKWRTLRLAAKH